MSLHRKRWQLYALGQDIDILCPSTTIGPVLCPRYSLGRKQDLVGTPGWILRQEEKCVDTKCFRYNDFNEIKLCLCSFQCKCFQYFNFRIFLCSKVKMLISKSQYLFPTGGSLLRSLGIEQRAFKFGRLSSNHSAICFFHSDKSCHVLPRVSVHLTASLTSSPDVFTDSPESYISQLNLHEFLLLSEPSRWYMDYSSDTVLSNNIKHFPWLATEKKEEKAS